MANKRCPQNQIQKKFHFVSQFTQFSSSYSFMQRLRMQWKSGTDTDRKEIISLLWGCYLISGNSIDFIIFLSYLFDNTTHTHGLMCAVRLIIYTEYCHWNEGTKQSWKKLWNVFLCLKVADISLKLDLSHSLGWQQHFFYFRVVVVWKIIIFLLLFNMKYYMIKNQSLTFLISHIRAIFLP